MYLALVIMLPAVSHAFSAVRSAFCGHDLRRPVQMRFPSETRYALDIGCGVGDSTKDLMDMVVETTFVVGIDYNKRLLEVAKRKHPHLFFMEMDGTDMKFDDSMFDMIQMRYVMSEVKKMNALLYGIWRVMKPHGKLIIVDYDFSHPYMQELLAISSEKRHKHGLPDPYWVYDVRSLSDGFSRIHPPLYMDDGTVLNTYTKL